MKQDQHANFAPARWGNEDAEEETKSLRLPVRVLILKSSLSLEKKKARFALESTIIALRIARCESIIITSVSLAFSRDIRPGCNDVLASHCVTVSGK